MDFGGVLELGYKYFNPSESIPHVSGTVGTLLVLERNLLCFFSLLSATLGSEGPPHDLL